MVYDSRIGSLAQSAGRDAADVGATHLHGCKGVKIGGTDHDLILPTTPSILAIPVIGDKLKPFVEELRTKMNALASA